MRHRPSRNATNPSAISSKSALRGSFGPRFDATDGGMFSFPGSSLRAFFVREDLFEGLRFLA